MSIAAMNMLANRYRLGITAGSNLPAHDAII